MIPVYILLTIIAIGVLLLSEAGKEILRCFGYSLAVGGIILVTVIIGGFLRNIKDTILTVIGTILITILVIGYGIAVYKDYKQGKFSRQAVKTKIAENWKQHPAWVIIWIVIFFLSIGLYIWISSIK